MEVWRINLHEGSFSREETPAAWQRLGGRALLARILLDEVPPTCDPLGSRNKLIFAPGLLVGHKLSSCDRISAGAKSPLTGGVKESNAGGSTGLQLTYLGIKALIIEGQPRGEDWLILRLDSQGVHFEPAGDVVGKGVYASAEELRRRYGTRAAIALIGPAGEMRLTAAGIVNLDKDGVPSRINARGGLGAVMGSKRIKAIVIDGSQGKAPPIQDEKAFRAAQREFTKALMAHPKPLPTGISARRGLSTCATCSAHCRPGISARVSLNWLSRSAEKICAASCWNAAERPIPLTPAWSAVEFAARMFMPTRTARSSSRRLSMKRLA
jgi:aldehyde:ferredoxin oxidoreductase